VYGPLFRLDVAYFAPGAASSSSGATAASAAVAAAFSSTAATAPPSPATARYLARIRQASRDPTTGGALLLAGTKKIGHQVIQRILNPQFLSQMASNDYSR